MSARDHGSSGQNIEGAGGQSLKGVVPILEFDKLRSDAFGLPGLHCVGKPQLPVDCESVDVAGRYLCRLCQGTRFPACRKNRGTGKSNKTAAWQLVHRRLSQVSSVSTSGFLVHRVPHGN
jgi:hypothetical protein